MIALHRQHIGVNGTEFGILVDEILALMRAYKTYLDNAASLGSYMRHRISL